MNWKFKIGDRVIYKDIKGIIEERIPQPPVTVMGTAQPENSFAQYGIRDIDEDKVVILDRIRFEKIWHLDVQYYRELRLNKLLDKD